MTPANKIFPRAVTENKVHNTHALVLFYFVMLCYVALCYVMLCCMVIFMVLLVFVTTTILHCSAVMLLQDLY